METPCLPEPEKSGCLFCLWDLARDGRAKTALTELDKPRYIRMFPRQNREPGMLFE